MLVDDIPPVGTNGAILPLEAVVATTSSSQKEYPQKKQHHHNQKKVRDYFHPLSIAIEATNKHLVDRHLPYRFRVFKRWGEVFIELCILNSDGTVRSTQKKNISSDDFNRIIDDVVSIEGLFFDQQA